MILKNNSTGEFLEVFTAEEAYDAFCLLNGDDCPIQDEYDSDLEILAQEVVDLDEAYHKAQDLYVLVTEAKNEQIVLADKLDQIAKLQKQKMDEKFAELQEVSKAFNELYEAEEENIEDDYDEDTDCGYNCKDCGYEECPERMEESRIGCVAPYNSAKSSFKLGDNYVELEARWNAPVSDDVWEYVIEKLAEQI